MPGPRFPIVLVVIDGWGVAPPGPHNAIRLANPANMDRLARDYASTELEASGPHVGLPEGQMGNSEVGHLNIGAGRIVDQEFVKISKVVAAGRLGENLVLRQLFSHCLKEKTALHVLGLLGPGGVHSHWDHLFGVVQAAKEAKVPGLFIHHFLDGRDTPPSSAKEYVGSAQERIRKIGFGQVATIAGRYWAMDRDKRWERTQRAYQMLTKLEGIPAPGPVAGVEAAYARGETDEFVQPTIIRGAKPIQPGDSVLVYNFRPDRVRQIVRALGDPTFREFATTPLRIRIGTMTQYDATFPRFGVQVAFPPDRPTNTMGEVYAKLGLKQLRIAETEKYAHVTYFFSGGQEEPFAGEDRILVPSPKVATYDLKPEMSARQITDQLLARLDQTPYDLVVLNFANPDMVGHTGMLDKTVQAVKVTDECIGRIADYCQRKEIFLAVTADHGNAESMVDREGRPQTAHTTNRVPLILAHESTKRLALGPGGLSSVAPTLLRLAGLDVPKEMTAAPLVADRARR